MSDLIERLRLLQKREQLEGKSRATVRRQILTCAVLAAGAIWSFALGESLAAVSCVALASLVLFLLVVTVLLHRRIYRSWPWSTK